MIMKKNKLSSFRILKHPEQPLINYGEFDFPVEIGYNKSQVTEQEAIANAIELVDDILPYGLCARIADAEQRILTKGDMVLMQIGIDLFTKN